MAFAPIVKVTGANDLSRALRQISTGLPRSLTANSRRAAKIVADEARQRAPERSGRLKRTINPVATRRGAAVRAGQEASGAKDAVVYAGPIHFGWAAHNIRPQPFLYDAADARAPEVLAAFTRGVQQLIDQAGLGR